MKSELLKKLSSYSALASLCMGLSKFSDAQTIYTDVNPDVSGYDVEFELDLNNDGVVDFIIFSGIDSWYTGNYSRSINWFYSTSVSVRGYNNNGIGIAYGINRNLAKPFSKGDTIGSSLLFDRKNSNLLLGKNDNDGDKTGLWPNQNEKFLGLKLHVGNNDYYGWARLVVFSGGKALVIKDYAYNLLPDKPIIAGEVVCPPISVDLYVPKVESCVSNPIVIKAIGNSANSYEWKKDNFTVLQSLNEEFNVTESGHYKVIGSYGVCQDTSEEVKVTINSLPDEPVINKFYGSFIGTDSMPGFHYQWFFGEYSIPDSDYPYIKPEWNGYYRVMVTDSNGCSSAYSNLFFVGFVNAEAIFTDSYSFQSFLSNRTLFIQNIPQEFLNGELKVFDVTGRKLVEQKIGTSSEQVNLSDLPDGLYILELSKNGLKERRKFVLN